MADRATGSPISVLLVDDQALLRHSLRIAFDREPDIAVVGEAATGTDAITAARTLRPDVILMDIRMPGGNGIDATREITRIPELAHTRILVLTMHDLDEYVYGALRAGASGLLLKDSTPDKLTDAVRRVWHGEALFAPTVLTRLIETYLEHPGTRSVRLPPELTARETEVLALIGRGLSNDEITERLVVSINTVKTHINRLHAKLGARDRAQLVIAAYDHGLAPAK
ncbi:response regulator transcription factor [Tamaricihabitans halophyticus]|uniref:response regulator transcription factor n=1 Tax=Tamaricihabitans halophyticus TaxID=1262583 RepID=UPI00104DD5B6